MSWLQTALQGNSPGVTLTLIVVALAVALVLLFWIFRKIAGGNGVKTSRGHRPRLSVTDAAVVDDKRRLVLVRRDNVEHLIMIGGPTDVLIEPGIAMAAASHQPHVATPQMPDDEPEPVEETEREPAEEPVTRHRHEEMRMPAAETASIETPRPAPARHRAEPAAPSAMPPRPIRAEMSAPRPASATPSATVAAAPPIGASHDSEAAFDEQFSSDLEEAFREEIPAGRTGSRPAAASLERSATRSDRLEVAPPEPPSMPAQQRGESMEEEMQRLLDELSGSKPN